MQPIIYLQKGTKLLVVGDIHEHEEQFDKALDYLNSQPNMIMVSVGDIYDKGFGTKVAESIVDKIKKLHAEGKAYIIRGNHELKIIRKAKKSQNMTPQLQWMRQQPLSLVFEFYNKTRVVVVHGGVSTKHKLSDLSTDVETCYIRTLDSDGKMIPLIRSVEDGKVKLEPAREGKVWHEMYDGRFGYIASGHAAQQDGIPKFYNYSCNLDTAVYYTGKLTAQVFSENGKEDLLTFTGKAKHPDLEVLHTLMAQGRV